MFDEFWNPTHERYEGTATLSGHIIIQARTWDGGTITMTARNFEQGIYIRDTREEYTWNFVIRVEGTANYNNNIWGTELKCSTLI